MPESNSQNYNTFITLPTREALPHETLEKQGSYAHQESLEYFNYVLVRAVAQSQVYNPQKETLTVTELGCGEAYTFNAITSFFSGVQLNQVGSSVRYTGIDTDANSIRIAIPRIRKLYQPIVHNTALLVADATQMNANPQVPKNADVIIARHPQVLRGSIDYLRAGYDNMATDGIMVVTTYDQTEIDVVNGYFGSQVHLTGATGAPNSGYADHFVSVIKK